IDHPRGSQSFGYDDRGLVTSASGDGGGSSFEYDQNGRMTRRADPGSYSDFHYNARGDLTSVGAAATGGTRTLSYDDARQLTSVAYGSGGAVRSFGYDGLGRTTADTLTGPGGTLRSQTYTYDNNDNPLTTVIGPAGVAGAGTQTYGYDRSDRLTAWTDPANVTTTYGWDAAGNRTAVNAATASFDERNRLLSDGSATYGYTARGTLSTRVAGATTTTTVFDAFDRLVSDTAGGATTTFAYDGLDRAAVRNGTSRLIYDGLDREPSVDGSAYARDPDGDIISAGTAAGNWATATDIHGSVVGAFTTDGAGLTDNRAYDPFGTPVVTGSANLRIGYQGSWTDPTSGKVDAQARWYTPGTGSFISRDSADLALTSAVSANRYVYAGANPLAYNDLTGRSFFSSIKNTTALAASAIVGGAAAAGAVVAASAVPAAELAGAAGLEATGAVLDSTVVGVGLGAAAGTLGVIVAGKAWDDLHSGSGSVPATQPAAAARPTTATQSATTAQANTATQANTAVRSGASAGARPAAGGGYAAPARATTSAPRAAAPAAAPKAAPVPLIHGTFYNGYSDAVLPPAVRSSDPAPISSGAVPLTAGGNTVDQTAGRQYIVQACQAPARCIGDARPTPTGAALPAAAAGAAAAAATEDPYGGLGAAPARRICAASGGTPLTDTCDPGAALTGEVAGYTGTPICGPGDDDCDLPGSQPASCDTPNSFDGATEVLLADGTRKRIEEVKVGDRVLATDPTTGRTEVHTVTAVIVGHGLKHLVDVTVATADGPRTLTATDHHPFWDDAHHGWVDADQLTSADRLRTPTGADVPVTATHDRDQTRTVYNLTVDTLHTYYVLAGTTPVLVHNSGACFETRMERAGDLAENYVEGQKTRDPSSQWYHEFLSDDELLDAINEAPEGDGILVSRGGKILGGHHRWDELLTRIADGRIDPNTEIRIDVLNGG
ncbi:polymorphic toxin-type HINT domain-containing protein, partial [Frankia sp. ACN1ag]|uniref:polymorphic toxin-type HINT domain-containing protein n=1 Tax=Frankia sp. ACN1ag TaxID=102891 RepID=UPI0021013AE0